jgi:hypothetical protein
MTLSNLEVQSILLRIAPTIPQILRTETIAGFRKKRGVTTGPTVSVKTRCFSLTDLSSTLS